MQVRCPKCKSFFEFDERLVGRSGRKLRCAFCHTAFFLSTEEEERDPDMDEQVDTTDPNLMGTMVLSLHNKPKHLEAMPHPVVPATPVRTTPPPQAPQPPRPSLSESRGQTSPPPPAASPPRPASPPEKIPEVGKIRKITLEPAKLLSLLQQNGWTAGMGIEELAGLARYMTLFQVPEGTAIFRRGDTNSFFCLVIKGQVKLLIEEANSISNQILTILGPGKSFGELALVDGQPRTAAAVASKDTFLLVLGNKQLDQMADTHPKACVAVLKRIAQVMSRRLRDLAHMESEYLKN